MSELTILLHPDPRLKKICIPVTNIDKALELFLERSQQPLEAVVLLELSDEVLVERLLSRGREDDIESVIRNRLEVYRDQTSPLIKHYRDKGLLYQVPAHGTIEEIGLRIEEILL